MVQNPTFGGVNADVVLGTQSSGPCTNLELVYPVLWEENQNEWEWVFHPVNDKQLPFLAPTKQSSGVLRVTLDSQGQWKALYANGRWSRLRYDTRPGWNELYDDYGYAPGYSPYGSKGDSESSFTPDKVNPGGYMPPQPPNKCREHSATQDNTTLFIGGINKSVTDEKLKQLFQQFGQINYVNRPHQTSGFVQYAVRRDALMAMRQMQGVPIYDCRLRISWGNPKQPQRVPQQMLQGFNNMPWAQSQQQQYWMPYYVPVPYSFYHHAQGHQYPYQQQTGYCSQYPGQQQMGYHSQYMAPPPPPPPTPFTEPSPQPALPQSAHSGHPPSLDASAASRKGSLKKEGPIVVSSDMVPNPFQESHGQSTPRDWCNWRSENSNGNSWEYGFWGVEHSGWSSRRGHSWDRRDGQCSHRRCG
ncbi:hypothetical protein FJTKL_00008 [Diaporthe vaccinii]|uniref:RRM domain-containing protein n=1 Tax=Diaporthe vaccinii TaxID=105482 RepID=A0ABR4E4W6_9PEZI